jgi:hypothetical protein
MRPAKTPTLKPVHRRGHTASVNLHRRIKALSRLAKYWRARALRSEREARSA